MSCVLDCPYEGDIPLSNVVRVAKALFDMGCYKLSLGDTIGVGSAGEVQALVRTVASEIPVSALAGHFHDTYGQALANIWSALEEEVRAFNSSVYRWGGCPYAPGASGNVSTEDVVYMLHRSGFETNINLDKLIETSWWISNQLGRMPSSKVAIARRA